VTVANVFGRRENTSSDNWTQIGKRWLQIHASFGVEQLLLRTEFFLKLRESGSHLQRTSASVDNELAAILIIKVNVLAQAKIVEDVAAVVSQ
jgi:hypothetical protein